MVSMVKLGSAKGETCLDFYKFEYDLLIKKRNICKKKKKNPNKTADDFMC